MPVLMLLYLQHWAFNKLRPFRSYPALSILLQRQETKIVVTPRTFETIN